MDSGPEGMYTDLVSNPGTGIVGTSTSDRPGISIPEVWERPVSSGSVRGLTNVWKSAGTVCS